MEYEVIREITDEQLERINKEFKRIFNPKYTMIVRAQGVEIGFCVVFFICGRLTVEYYLFREHQHKGYGGTFVSIVSDAIGSDYPDYDTLYLLIHKTNVPSMKVAQKSGYKMECYDWDFRSMICDEMPDQYLFSKGNPYYKRHIKAKTNKTIIN